jgi:Protein of unknown function (DUF2934)
MDQAAVDFIMARVTGEGGMGKNTGGSARTSPLEVARRAYSLYEARGGEDGRDVDDWLLAERQLTR